MEGLEEMGLKGCRWTHLSKIMTCVDQIVTQVTSYVSSLQYLKGCTSTYVMPSPSILHKLLTEHLLDQVNNARPI